MHDKIAEASEKDIPKIIQQVKLFFKRCQILQASIAFLTFSIFLVGLSIFMLFAWIIFRVDIEVLIEICFGASIGMLIISLTLFLIDIGMTLKSLRIEVGDQLNIK